MLKKSLFALILSILSLSGAYFLIVPPNAGPEELNHAQAAFYLAGNPSEIFSNQKRISGKFPSELTISNPGGYLGNLACFSQNMAIPSSCQKLETGKVVSGDFPMLNRSNFYYLIVGYGERFNLFNHAYYSGKIISFSLCLVLILISICRLYLMRVPNSLLSIYFAMTGTVYFFFSVINPSSLEFAATIYFSSSLVISLRKSSFASILHLISSAILLVLSRSLGGLWVISFAMLIRFLNKELRYFRGLMAIGLLGLSLQYFSGNKNYPLGEWNPPWNFYLEEAVRVFNGSGDWIVSYFGTLSWSEIRLPLIFIFILLLSYTFILLKVTSQYPSQRNVLNFFFCGIWLIPFVLAVVFSKDWPGFWQGRYSLPFLMGAILILISNSNPIDLHIPATFLFLSNVYLILLTFARFNWGLYGTNTPIISNGWSFSGSVTATFFALIAVYLLSTVYFLKQQIVIFKNISPIS